MTHDYLTEIKARLGSIAPSKMNEFPRSVQRLLEEDMPRLIRVVEAVEKVFFYEIPRRETSRVIDEVAHLNAATREALSSKHP